MEQQEDKVTIEVPPHVAKLISELLFSRYYGWSETSAGVTWHEWKAVERQVKAQTTTEQRV